ncbi:CdaR family transcriptional regulator [Williamsia sp. CHRR-6]|uniref:PucR family transcriptional regulator n=1 Tax=Williamsia sp. CHRR-6 TaxID=2835871 RepID=UPI001BDAEC2A|nr:helix-turn-helix domain-containing protein [Williamsia sp. CHRR-6]MBT0566961.1 helix-turn-helix domain-containing protein [Williamsia sp. CHRR-6]
MSTTATADLYGTTGRTINGDPFGDPIRPRWELRAVGADRPITIIDVQHTVATMLRTLRAALSPDAHGDTIAADLRATVAEISDAARRWARADIPLTGALAELSIGFDTLLADLSATCRDNRSLRAGTTRVLSMHSQVSGAIAISYADHTADSTPDDIGCQRRALADALLLGRAEVREVAAFDIPVTDRWQVIAVSTTPLVGPRRVKGSLTECVHDVLGNHVLPLLSDNGGSILVPISCDADIVGDAQRTEIAERAGIDLVFTSTVGPAETLPAMAEQSDVLVDLTRGMGVTTGSFTLDDLAVEYQMTRPGPGRDRLTALIAPLGTEPELLHTLRTYLASGLDRRATAKALAVHPNTVDNRMIRVASILDLDLARPEAMVLIRSALLAESSCGHRPSR